jgi:hypothetical protein
MLIFSAQSLFLALFLTFKLRFSGKGERYNCLSLFLTKHHAKKTYWRIEVQLHTFLTLALDGGECSFSHSVRFIPGVRASYTFWKICLVRTGTGLDTVVMNKIPSFIAPAGN